MRKVIAVFGLVSAVILVYLIYPFIALLLAANPAIIEEVLEVREALNALVLSLEAATTSTLILLFSGIPLAYLLARHEFRGKGLIESIIDLPLVVPHAVVGIMLLSAFGPRTTLGEALKSLGLVIADSFWGVVAAFAFISAPLLIDTVREGFASINTYLEGVARTLGAGPGRAFLTISLPLAARSVFTGSLLAWARAMSEVGALLIIAYYPKTINVLIVEWFNTYGLSYAVALTLVLLSVSITIFVILRAALRWRG